MVLIIHSFLSSYLFFLSHSLTTKLLCYTLTASPVLKILSVVFLTEHPLSRCCQHSIALIYHFSTKQFYLPSSRLQSLLMLCIQFLKYAFSVTSQIWSFLISTSSFQGTFATAVQQPLRNSLFQLI